MSMSNPGNLTISLASVGVAAVIQASTAPLPEPLGWIAQVKDLGLTGALMLVCFFLYRMYKEKDQANSALQQEKDKIVASLQERLLESQKQTVSALVTNAETARTFTETIQDVVESNRSMTTGMKELTECVQRFTTAREAVDRHRGQGSAL